MSSYNFMQTQQAFVTCCLILILSTAPGAAIQQVISSLPISETSVTGLAISTSWQALGPFQLGTREAIWGADPLEAFGGFHTLSFAKHSKYPSSLVPNASLGWSDFEGVLTQTTDTITVEWRISHPKVDWYGLQQIYGWSALQYQTWIRGEVHNRFPYPRCISIIPRNILEYSINEQHIFGGDVYDFRRAPLRIYLKPGRNVVNVRLVRDVRAQGGLHPPDIDAALTLEPCLSDVRVLENSFIAPEASNGKLSSCYVGVSIQNLRSNSIRICTCSEDKGASDADLLADRPIRIAAGQILPISLAIRNDSCGLLAIAKPVLVHLCHTDEPNSKQTQQQRISFTVPIRNRQNHEARRITFIHPSGVVNYALLKPPVIADDDTGQIPLMVGLHGAGVEADSNMMRHALDGVPDLRAVTLFPTGLSPWAGDDWHTWGYSDILASIRAVEDWQVSGQWNGPSVKTNRFLLTGHSNGGQGAWYLATHLPDRVLAAAPASAYTSIENYVPYNFWSISDQNRILDVARKNFRNELFIENVADMSVLQQHGSLDDNVPPYNARLMSSLRAQAQMNSTYIEILGKNHWWNNAMSTSPLKHFYRHHLSEGLEYLTVPDHFSIVVPNSDDAGSRFGIIIDQLRSSDQIGRIEVHTSDHVWHIKTSNIHRFHFDSAAPVDNPPRAVLLDHEVETRPVTNRSFVLSPLGSWIADEAKWETISTRYGRQRGTIDAILRTQGHFQIVDMTTFNQDLAVQISLNLLQYFGAASNISNSSGYQDAMLSPGNLITLVLGQGVPTAQILEFPITFTSDGIVLQTNSRPHRVINYSSGLGLAMLRPLPNARLELLVWGQDAAGLRLAMRMIPTLTGAGQPDFIILGPQARWKGHGGAIALGFFDHDWSISAGSYVW